MSDLDPIVSRLREDVAAVRWADPGEIRARGARRTVHQLVGTVAAVIVLSAVAVGVAAAGNRPDHGVVPGTSGTPSTAAEPSTTPRSTVSPPYTPPAGVPPADPTVDDLTFVSPTVGWLLTGRTCPGGRCGRALVHTADGGRTWTALPPLPVDLTGLNVGVRFANAQVGYLYSSDVLYLTRDGGTTWQKQPEHADALEVLDGTVLRLTSTFPNCVPGCTYRIQRAAVGGTAWTTVNGPELHRGLTQLLRTGHRAFALGYGNPAGGVDAHADLLTSGDDGTTWTARPDPCGTRSGVESDGVRASVADDGSLTVLCYVRFSGNTTFVVTSTDGGTTFGPQRLTPGTGSAVGAVSARTLLVSTFDQGTLRLYRSDDGGTTWAVAATAPERLGDGEVPPGDIGFQNATHGWWLPGHATVFATADAGQTWQPYRPAG